MCKAPTSVTTDPKWRASQSLKQYPALMAYILDRNQLDGEAWCDQLNMDETDARRGLLADVANELARAKSDYIANQKRARRPWKESPRDAVMALWLGLPITRARGPGHGYYMACSVLTHSLIGRQECEAA